MHKKFIKALTLNTSAAFLYKAMLLFHQIILYSIISKTLYGVQSSIFASIYFMISVTNFGFEETLLPYFSIFSQSKYKFSQLLYFFTIRIIIATFFTTAIYNGICNSQYTFIANIKSHCDYPLLIIIMLIFFIESIKKSINAIAQLAFLNKQIAYAELSMIFIYISTVWTSYAIHKTVSLHTIFIPMLVTVTIELVYFMIILFQYYLTLPDILAKNSKTSSITLCKQSIYNYIHQISKALFSPNSMTVLLAYLLGFQQVAIIKFFTNIITLSYTFIYKIISTAGGATLSRTRHASNDIINNIFSKITKIYFQFLLIMTIIIIITLGCSWYTKIITNNMLSKIVLFFIIGFLEQITLTYERLFISQHRSSILAIINSCELLILLPTTYYILFCENQTQYNYLIFVFFIVIKLTSLCTMSFLAKKYWNIQYFCSLKQ